MAVVTCTECDPAREFPNGGLLKIHQIKEHGAAPPAPRPPRKRKPKAAGPEASGFEPPDLSVLGAEEPRPEVDGQAPGKRGVRERLQGFWGPKDRPPPDPKRPRVPAKKRQSTAPILGLAWGLLGKGLERSGADVPVGRVLQFQQPYAGSIIDGLIAKTWLDRALQPLAARADNVEQLGTLVAMPILTAFLERSPESQALVLPLLRESVEKNLGEMVAVIEQRERDAAKLADITAKLQASGDLPPTDPAQGPPDPAMMVLQAIFAPPPGMEQQQPPPAGAESNGTSGDHQPNPDPAPAL